MSASPSTPTVTPTSPCPCGSGRPFQACCQPILQRARPAANAEELMRSRFTAHVVLDLEHLHRTDLETAKTPFVPDTDAPDLTWTRLVVHAHEPGARPDLAYVDFTAYFVTGQAPEQPLHEKSEFRRVDGTWYYTRAVRQGPAPVKAAPKAGRNDPCPCGSGKKFKVCCGK